MAMPSSLISKIQSVLSHRHPFGIYDSTLIIGLRNLKAFLVCLRNLGDADKHAMQSLFSRIEDAIGRADSAYHGNDYDTKIENRCAINCLGKEVKDECERHANAVSNHLTLDDVVEIADSLLDNTAHFWEVAESFSLESFFKKIPDPSNLREVMDEVEVQIRFLRGFLLFAKWAAVGTQSLLIHLRPFLLKATRMFMIDETSLAGPDWVGQVESKCPRLDPTVFQVYTQILLSISTLDQIVDAAVSRDFLSSFISLLWHMMRYHSHSLKPLYECLRLSRFNLRRNNNNSDFEARIGILIRESGILICSVYPSGVVDPVYLLDLLQRFDVVQPPVLQESNSLWESVLEFGDSTAIEEGVSDCKLQIDTVMASAQASNDPQVVGFEDDVCSVKYRLLRGSKQLRLVPISGMAGLGKTTFALELYNLRSVMYHFHARARCIISQVFDKKNVLLQLLKQIQPGNYSKMTEDDLANKLRQSLKGKRYLILLDDVWTPEVWENLRSSFPDEATQSRVVFTSRLRAIVPDAQPDEQPHFLRPRTEEECLIMIQMKLLHNAVDALPQENIAQSSIKLKKFAKLCCGLPLTAVLVAGLLSTIEQEDWDNILEHFSSGGLSRIKRCNIALELSYQQLPDYLKPCFIYFGAFPEDKNIHARKLIRLWMAEGFVAKRADSGKKRIEDVAREYLDELIQRNLVMITTERSIGGVKHCRIHDLLHDFCLMKGKQENLFHRLLQAHDGLSDFNEPSNLVRLSIHSTAHHFVESMLFCPLARSILHFTSMENTEGHILCDMLFIIQIYKHLRVLDMDRIWLTGAVPSEIALLNRLTYLSIRSYMPVISSSIGNLLNLETLIVKFSHWNQEAVSLPHTIWNLQNLKYLHISFLDFGIKGDCFSLPTDNLENSPNLLELESICGVLLYSDKHMINPMRKFPNIRKMKCNVLCGGESSEELDIVVVPEFFSQLESLALRTKRKCYYQFDFGSAAANLRKMTLKGFLLSREEIAVMGKLPKLESLKLEEIVFLGCNMEMKEGEFLRLRVLKLHGKCNDCSNLETWTATGDEILPCLEKVVFYYCAKLKEIPDYYLATSSTLENIEVFFCCSTLEILVRSIEEAQKDLENSIMVQISSDQYKGDEEGEEYGSESESEKDKKSEEEEEE